MFSDIPNDKEARYWGDYIKIDAPHRIKFPWNTVASDETDLCIVALSIEQDGQGSIATIVK